MAKIDTVAGLLAQADSTEFGPERDAFMEKAQILATNHGIDLALARQHQKDKTKREEPEERRVQVGVFGKGWKTPIRNNGFMVELFSAIAGVNDVRITIGGSNVYVYATGFPSDLDVTEKMFELLAVQMVTEADVALKRGDNKRWVETQITEIDDYYGERVLKYDDDGNPVIKRVQRTVVDGRIWRANFYDGFISRLSSRLWAARHQALKDAGVDMTESTGTAMALRDKTKEVDDLFEEKTKHLKATWQSPEPTRYSDAGQEAGREAAARANLADDSTTVEGSSQRRGIGS